MWDGRIYIGTRGGHLYILGDPSLATTPTTATTSTPSTRRDHLHPRLRGLTAAQKPGLCAKRTFRTMRTGQAATAASGTQGGTWAERARSGQE